MKNKLTTLLIGFLLLFPFRLPISILMIYGFDGILEIINQPLPREVVCTNVITTKIVYNLALGVWMIYSVEMYSRELMGRKAISTGTEIGCYYWTVFFGIGLVAFTIIDAVSIYNIFYN